MHFWLALFWYLAANKGFAARYQNSANQKCMAKPSLQHPSCKGVSRGLTVRIDVVAIGYSGYSTWRCSYFAPRKFERLFARLHRIRIKNHARPHITILCIPTVDACTGPPVATLRCRRYFRLRMMSCFHKTGSIARMCTRVDQYHVLRISSQSGWEDLEYASLGLCQISSILVQQLLTNLHSVSVDPDVEIRLIGSTITARGWHWRRAGYTL